MPALAAGVESGVELLGDPPDQAVFEDEKRAEMSLEYSYQAPVNTEAETTVHVEVEEKPEWLAIDLPTLVQIPVNRTQTSVTKDIPVTFNMRGSAFPPAFNAKIVTVRLRAEQNGGIAAANNTRSFVIHAGFRSAIHAKFVNPPIELPTDETGTGHIKITNLANDKIRPSFRIVDRPANVEAQVLTATNIIPGPRQDRANTVTYPIVVRDRGSAWPESQVEVRIEFIPVSKPGAPGGSVTLRTGIVPTGGDSMLLAPAVLGAAAGGVGWYLYRSRKIHWPEALS